MSQKYNELKDKFLRDKKYSDFIYLDQDEEKVIMEMDTKTRRDHLLDNKIRLDTDTLSENCNHYYRVKVWDISDEEFSWIMQMESSKKIDKIYYILSFFFVVFMIGIVLSVVTLHL